MDCSEAEAPFKKTPHNNFYIFQISREEEAYLLPSCREAPAGPFSSSAICQGGD